jgi:uncharacterized iron-regulated membrane protein
MNFVDLLHRWTGGLLGLLLGMLGLTGAILVHKDAWVLLPHARDAQVQDLAVVAAAVERLLAGSPTPNSITFASRDFGLHRVRFTGEAGAYADQTGAIVARWDDKWERPELWLFDLHHYLWAGETGALVAGWVALIGLGFVATGLILWWTRRRTFEFRLWPARMDRPRIIRQHRDFGVVVAPLLTLSLLTGAMLTLRPVANLLLTPWGSSAELRGSLAAPQAKGGVPAQQLKWTQILGEARQRFPDAEFRVLSLPQKPGALISIRMRQAAEWLPNGRSTLWFDASDGRLVEARDALSLPRGAQMFNAVYPLHAAKVGGLPYRIVMTASGLALCLLGTLSVWTFWFRRPRARPSRNGRAQVGVKSAPARSHRG